MTYKEAIRVIHRLLCVFSNHLNEEDEEEADEAISTIEKLVEQTQQIIEDHTIQDVPKDYKYDTENEEVYEYRNPYTGDVIHIAKQTPLFWCCMEEPKVGKWKMIRAEYEFMDTFLYFDGYKCSECGHEACDATKYCPSCGSYNGGIEE